MATISREVFHAAVKDLSSVVPSRSPKPILQSIFCSIDQDDKGVFTAVLVATDQEIAVQREFPVAATEKFEAVIPADQLRRVLDSAVDDDVELSVDGAATILRTSRSDFEIPGEKPEDFPLPTDPPEMLCLVNGARLKGLIRRTMFASGPASQPGYGGILWEHQDGNLTLVASDGKRVAMGQIPQQGPSFPANTIVPIKAVSAILANLDDFDVKFGVTSGSLWLADADTLMSCRLASGRFPAYRLMFPKEPQFSIDMGVEPLLTTLKAASIATADESREVELVFDADVLAISSSAANRGKAKAKTPIPWPHERIEVAFDSQYLMEALRSCGDPRGSIAMELTGQKIDGDIAYKMTWRFPNGGWTHCLAPIKRRA